MQRRCTMQSAKTFASAGSGMVQRPPLQVFTCAFPSLRTQVAAFLLIAPLQVDVPALSMARLAPRAVRAVANATQSSHCRAVASQTPFGSRPWLHGQQQQQGGCSGLAPAAVGMQGSTWPAGWRTLALGSVASGASASAAPFPALVAPRGGQGASDIQQPTAPLAARPAAAAGWLQRPGASCCGHAGQHLARGLENPRPGFCGFGGFGECGSLPSLGGATRRSGRQRHTATDSALGCTASSSSRVAAAAAAAGE